MFRGIDDVDWASLGHAYTDSATDVPELLWGLASDDPELREIALDGMYGAVHHQGDVYDSTLACVPFLFELIASEAIADRGAVVGLLCSIAGASEDHDTADDDWFGESAAYDPEVHEDWQRPFLDARDMVRARAGVFLGLLDDPDPGVRAAVPAALARLHAEPVRVLGVLRGRLAAETDPEAARSLARALGTLAVRLPADVGAEAGGLLRELVAGVPDPELRMTALTELARCAPGELPPDTVEIALDVMRLARETAELPPAPPAPGRPRTDTLISHLRELEAEHRRGLGLHEADELLAAFHGELRDRADIRFPLLVGMLESPDGRQRRHAVSMAGRLLTGWRAPDDEPVLALARLLREDDLRLQKEVLRELRHLAPVSHGASAELVCYVEAWEERPVETGTPFAEMALGLAFEVVALQGDERIVPGLGHVLEVVEIPENLPRWIEALGPVAAAPLGPVLHARLTALGHPTPSAGLDALTGALGLLRHGPSVPLLTRILRETTDVRTRRAVLGALCDYGPSAAEAAEPVRQWWETAELREEERVEAARALWALTGDAEAVLPLVRESLRSRSWGPWYGAIRLTGALGRSGAALAPTLRDMIAAGETPARAAAALWQVTGDPEEVLPSITEQWPAAPKERPALAAALAGMGPAAAPALPLIRAELASVRRHNNDGSGGNMRYDVRPDVALLADCRRVLAACGGQSDEEPTG
ncbi:HEAT repeat domain-containing protein [Streptomyces sp. L2]|uniref:HEAT repeat domain-containing protein n=1 Tax=Streptomyces sp. L2 TaxID=2162665 RepID=UPI001013A41B|nr:HEAT repeat domain-containing protein [Streptomyces sp. L2]